MSRMTPLLLPPLMLLLLGWSGAGRELGGGRESRKVKGQKRKRGGKTVRENRRRGGEEGKHEMKHVKTETFL